MDMRVGQAVGWKTGRRGGTTGGTTGEDGGGEIDVESCLTLVVGRCVQSVTRGWAQTRSWYNGADVAPQHSPDEVGLDSRKCVHPR